MENTTAEFNLIKNFLENLHLGVALVDEEVLQHAETLSIGIYPLIYPVEAVQRYYTHMLASYRQRVLYKLSDMLMCSYYIFIMPGEAHQACIIGPFTEQTVTEEDILRLMQDRDIPHKLFKSIANYYSSLRLIEDVTILQTLLSTYMAQLWGGMDQFELNTMGVESAGSPPLSRGDEEEGSTDQTISDMALLQERYDVENQMLRAISLGELHTAEMLMAKFQSMQTAESRAADPLRNMKNYSIIYNSLFRKAAEQGKVHPIHINQLSSQFAYKIEACRTMEELETLRRDMLRRYCLMVRNHSMTGYSQLIQQALTIINGDLTQELSLSTIAAALTVNASYLSTQFKKELGQTLTDYVTQKRIEHAVLLLNSTDRSVAAIAAQCGIPDVQYFSKIFKRRIGHSPSEYRKLLR